MVFQMLLDFRSYGACTEMNLCRNSYVQSYRTARRIGVADGLRSASSTRCCPTGVWFSVSVMISRMEIQERVALG
jgi:hypothetical protein